MTQQIYDSYWNFTLAYTDFNSSKFIGTLQSVISFIDRTSEQPDTFDRYGQLQTELQRTFKLNDASIRKAINQLVKMGFVNSGLRSYHPDAKPYIQASNNQQRKVILSRVVYSNASFTRTATSDSTKREINFIVKTLEENGKLNKHELAALMRMEVGNFGSDFASISEIEQILDDDSFTEFEQRKYNQIDHLWNLLRKLDGIVIHEDGYIYMAKDDLEVADSSVSEAKGRDKYLHGIYKRQLKAQVLSISGRLQCMVDQLDYPAQMYIASHIKPFKHSSTSEAYDPDNGLLLSLNVDKFFDAGLISFDDQGNILISKRLNAYSKGLNDYLLSKSLNPINLNEKRKKYLEYHRTKVFN